jgi:hypothetical protein
LAHPRALRQLTTRAAAAPAAPRPHLSAPATDTTPFGVTSAGGGSAAGAGGGAGSPSGAAILNLIAAMIVPALFIGRRRPIHSPGSLALVLRLERPG